MEQRVSWKITEAKKGVANFELAKTVELQQGLKEQMVHTEKTIKRSQTSLAVSHLEWHWASQRTVVRQSNHSASLVHL